MCETDTAILDRIKVSSAYAPFCTLCLHSMHLLLFFVFIITIRINDARTKLLLLFGPWEHWPQNSWAHGCIAPSDATRWRKHSGAQNLNAEPKNAICIYLYIYFFYHVHSLCRCCLLFFVSLDIFICLHRNFYLVWQNLYGCWRWFFICFCCEGGCWVVWNFHNYMHQLAGDSESNAVAKDVVHNKSSKQ